MKLTEDAVDYVAALARIALTVDERVRLTDQLSSILTHIDALRELDTSSISPTAYVAALHDVLRDDVIVGSMPVDTLLANAPERMGDLLRVDAVFEE